MTAKPMNKADREKWYAEVVDETNKELAQQDEIIHMAREAGLWPGVTDVFPKELERFAALVAAHAQAEECEAIAQMFDDAPNLIQSVQNSDGGCLICGFTPKNAAAAIRARGEK